MLLYDAVRAEREYVALCDHIRQTRHNKNHYPTLVTGLSEGARDAFYATLARDLRDAYPNRPILWILPEEKAVLRVAHILEEAGLSFRTFPGRDLVFDNITASREYEWERIAALCAIQNNTCDAVITTPDAALSYTIPRVRLAEASFTLDMDTPCPLDALIDRLSDAGYARVELVDGVGEFAVRGGIVDIYPVSADHPVRLELWGDDIDSMGIFDPLTQRKIEAVSSCFIPPAHEILLSAEGKKSLLAQIRAQLKRCTSEEGAAALRGEEEVLTGGREPGFLDKYISFLYPERECLFSYFSDTDADPKAGPAPLNTPFLAEDTGRIEERLTAAEYHMREAITGLLEARTIQPKYAEYTRYKADYAYVIGRSRAILCDTFTPAGSQKLAGIFSFRAKQLVSYADSYETLLEDVRHYRSEGYRLVLLSENNLSAKALADSLHDEEIPTIDGQPDMPYAALIPGVPAILTGVECTGFALTDSRFALLSTFGSHSAYARAVRTSAKRKKKKQSAAEKILSYADLTVGDYVVHVHHGVGQYMGIETIRDIEGAGRDYVKIKYAGADALFLPCDQLDMISKYIGAHAEDGLLKLSKMGGTEWKKTTARVRAAAKEMAKELTQLYAARLRRPGFAFGADDEMQRAFESVFPYEETDSQISAIAEVKADMQRPTPMDRLLCGDVGYGKTEVALRAAMKAIESGKQVALLVPTTILAMQHYQTALSRFRGLPVTVEILSRFRTPKQQEEILRRLRRGEIDLIIGTHRLVSRDVVFRDLGLVIIDEEQRFGVAHKEKLKTLSENVDCLTLTATPIPRTLNMAMSGIRDMSVLDEAPGDRVPIQTYVLEYDELILSEALKKELRRGGQVFWLHNRVEDIDLCAARVSSMVPDAVIAVAHGKMEKEEISDIWQQLVTGEVDILISTTIIETGIDVPNANTLVIENADRMGLSQLHQIRGRIGRSARRAYAYFTYPKGKLLSEISTKRLQAIREYTEFGSGFKIAMRDLEIRGAGNILGAEQHGHMDSVGYDLYIKILNEAILEEKGEALPKKTETTVSLSTDAYLPESYVSSAAQRIDLYKKIAAIETEEDMSDILDEMTDRFGTPPKAATSLVRIACLRATASALHITRIDAKERTVLFYPVSFDAARWLETAKQLAPADASRPVTDATDRSSQGAGKRAPRGTATPPTAGKYTPLARAAAMVSAGNRAKARSTAAQAPAAIRLTVSAGQTPCVAAHIRGTGDTSLLSGTEAVLRAYAKAGEPAEETEIT